LNGVSYVVSLSSLFNSLVVVAEEGASEGKFSFDKLNKVEYLTPVSKKALATRPGIANIHYSVPHLPESTPWPVENIFPGLVAVIGDTGAGKTWYVEKTLRPDFIVRVSEPLEHVDYDDNVISASSVPQSLNIAVALSLLGFTTAVDSLRSLVYGGSGAAMEGGLSASLFDTITSLNNVIAAAGASIVCTMNPMLSSLDKMDRLFVRIDASCAGAVLIETGAATMESYRVWGGRVRKENGVHVSSAGPVSIESDVNSNHPQKPLLRGMDEATNSNAYGVGMSEVGLTDDDDKNHPPRRIAPFNL
jgi:hypothetical protein